MGHIYVLGCSNKKVFYGFAASKVVEAGEVIETAGVPDARKISVITQNINCKEFLIF